MAVAFIRATENSAVSDTLTLNIQSSGTDRVLVVGLAYKSNSVLTPNSIVFNGTENFTVERSAADGGDAQCFLYYLTAPSVATADVVITMPSSVRMVGFVALLNGVHQTTPFTANTNEAQGTNDSPTVDISSAADEICIDILVQVSAGPDTATATHTEICNGSATGGGSDTRGAGQYVAGQATRTMNYSMSDSDNWNIIAGALQEPAGISGATKKVDRLATDIVAFSPTPKAGARVSVSLLVISIVAFSVTPTAGAKQTVSLLDQNIVPYATTQTAGARVSVNLLTQNIVPYAPTIRAGASTQVNLLKQNLVAHAVTVKTGARKQVNLLAQNAVLYAATAKVGARETVALLTQNITPYVVTPYMREGYRVRVFCLTQKIVLHAITPHFYAKGIEDENRMDKELNERFELSATSSLALLGGTLKIKEQIDSQIRAVKLIQPAINMEKHIQMALALYEHIRITIDTSEQ